MPKKTSPSTINQTVNGNDNIQVVGNENIINRITNFFAGDTEQQRAQRNRRAMLELVKNTWIKGVLENSLYNEVLIDLRMEEHPSAVEHPWDVQVQMPNRTNRTLPAGTSMIDIFDEMNGTILVLGEPGSGKTTMLLELARDLILRAEQDPARSIPVVFNLSSWSTSKQQLGEWLLAELNIKYNIPEKIARPWIENDDLLLLLDGLDEVAPDRREACVRAINNFREEYFIPVAVCSRIADYEVLATRLKLQGAVLLQPFTPEQVNDYLNRFGQELVAVKVALRQDPTIQELAQSPLILSIMALAYRGTPVGELHSLDPVTSRRRHLFDAYIQRMFERRSSVQTYSPKQAIFWLTWLSKELIQHAQTVFLIDDLQPSWLPTHMWRLTYVIGSRLIIGLILGSIFGVLVGVLGGSYQVAVLIYGISAGLTIGIIDGLRLIKEDRKYESEGTVSSGFKRLVLDILVYWLSVGGVGGMLWGWFSYIVYRNLRLFAESSVQYFVDGLTFGLLLGVPIAVTFGLRSNRRTAKKDIQPVESLIWSWRRFVIAFSLIALLPSVILAVYSTNALTKRVILWNAQNGSMIARIGAAADDSDRVIFSPDMERLVTAGYEVALVLDVRNGARITELIGHTGQITSVDFSPQGTRIVTASVDKTARLWNAQDYSLIKVLTGHIDMPGSAIFNKNGDRILTKSDYEAILWNSEDGALIAAFKGDYWWEEISNSQKQLKGWYIRSAQFSSDGTRVITGSSTGEVKVWNASNGSLIATLDNYRGRLETADISPDGKRMVTVDVNSSLILWDAESYTPISNPSILASWVLGSRRASNQIDRYSVGFKEDGTLVIVMSHNSNAWLWDGKPRSVVSKPEVHQEAIRLVRLSPKGSRLVTMDRRGKIVLWSAQTGQLLALAEPVSIYDTNRGIAFSPDDSMLVTTSSVEDQRITALLIGILGTLLSIFSGLVQGGVSLKTFPNQGIRLSLKHAVLIGIGFGLIVSIIFTIMTYISLGDAGRIDYNDIYVVVALGGMATLIAGAWYGGLDIIQHYSLRLVLGLNGSIPWNYERFLDYAANRIFLRRVGGGYIFVHRLLMEHFAEMYSEDEKAK